MSLRRRQLRTLRAIERDLAGSDPGLGALFGSFSRRIGGLDMRWVEKIDRRRLWPWRRHRWSLGERVKDWCDP